MTARWDGRVRLTDRPPPRATAATLRRWVRRRSVAARGRVSPETLYVVVLTLAVAGAMVGPKLVPGIWPAVPAGTAPVAGPSVVPFVAGLGLAGLGWYASLRRAGPIIVGRSDLTWLFPAPVDRRELLRPALVRILIGAALVGALSGVVAVGRLAVRPVASTGTLTGVLLGAGVGVLVASVAVRMQRRTDRGRLDLAVAGTAVLLAAVAADDRLARLVWEVTSRFPALGELIRPGPVAATIAAAGLAVVGLLVAATVRLLDRLPPARLHEASTLAGSYLDAVYAVEPSYLSDLSERRYWRRRAVRAVPVRRIPGLPVLLVPDLLVVRRKGGRLAWLGVAALVPAVLAGGPAWLVVAGLLLGALAAAGTTMDAVRRDAAQPALLHLLGRTGRQVVAARLLVPAVLAAGWLALALAVLAWLGHLAPGPWWALGVALGPAVAVAAVHQARAGSVDHGLPLVDTPMGSFAPGPMIWLFTGPDLLLPLAVPTLVGLIGDASRAGLPWYLVLVQAVLSGLGALGYLYFATDRRRGVL